MPTKIKFNFSGEHFSGGQSSGRCFLKTPKKSFFEMILMMFSLLMKVLMEILSNISDIPLNFVLMAFSKRMNY